MTKPNGTIENVMPNAGDIPVFKRAGVGQARALTGRLRNGPLFIVTGYLLFTILLFAFGPWPWVVDSPAKLYSYLALYTIALVIGYVSGSHGTPKQATLPVDWAKVFNLALPVSGVLIALNYIVRAKMGASIINGILNPGDVYQLVQEASLGVESGKGSLLGYLAVYGQVFFGALTAIIYPFVMVYWSELRPAQRAAGLASVFLSLIVNVFMTGATKSLADFFLVLPWLLWLGLRRRSAVFFSTRRIIVVGIAAIMLFIVVLVFFGKTVAGRSKDNEVLSSDQQVGIQADEHNIFVSFVPSSLRPALIGLAHYISQGYYGMSLCLELPFEPCYGVGNSVFLAAYVEKFTGEGSVIPKTYSARAEAIFGAAAGPGRWHSIYPWLASDVTFAGAAVIVFLIGRLLALTWIDTIGGKNPIALSLFCFLLICVFYFPANNQIVQNSSQCIPFYVTLLLWLRFRGPTTIPFRSSSRS